MLASFGNLLDAVQGDRHQESVTGLLDTPNLNIERLCLEGEAEVRVLSSGDYVLIPARLKHRVEWTNQDHATIWLAVHYPETR
jgi:hypothetical protein